MQDAGCRMQDVGVLCAQAAPLAHLFVGQPLLPEQSIYTALKRSLRLSRHHCTARLPMYGRLTYSKARISTSMLATTRDLTLRIVALLLRAAI